MKIRIPDPVLQMEFAALLAKLRPVYLKEALSKTVSALEIPDLDAQLAIHVPRESLTILAMQGLRGEMVFPTPILLRAAPKLLAYYRLLYGYSQKEFYSGSTGLSKFKVMEERGFISARLNEQLEMLCTELCKAGTTLLLGMNAEMITPQALDSLTLLTLGPQLRGGANVKKGMLGIRQVFEVIQKIVNASVIEASKSRLKLRNAAGQIVFIEFAPDPDIIIRVEMRPKQYRLIIAIEVKAGSDFSNLHNRIGEAEKSHAKARVQGYTECWTIVNVDKIKVEGALKVSRSTNRFYRMSDLLREGGEDYQDFEDRIISLTGIKSKSANRV